MSVRRLVPSPIASRIESGLHFFRGHAPTLGRQRLAPISCIASMGVLRFGSRQDAFAETAMAREQTKAASAIDRVDPVWARIRHEAEEVVRREPELATFIYSTVLHHGTLEAAVVHRVTERLDHPDVSA